MRFATSKLNIFKDALGFVSLALILGLAIFYVIPQLKQSQLDALETGYIGQQKALLKATVENEAQQVVELRRALLAQGLDEARALQVIHSQLLLFRYGANGFGYFFAIDRDQGYVLHPLQPQLVGRRLSDVTTPDGQNLGKIFREALGDQLSGFVEYQYPRPSNFVADKKTSYVQYLPEFGWYLGSGFYHSDLLEAFASFRTITDLSIQETQRWFLIAITLLTCIFLAAATLIFLQIRRSENQLAQQLLQLEQYKQILDESSLVSRTDVEGRITYVNDTFIQATGHPRETVLGQSHAIERHPDTPLEVFQDLWGTISQGKVWRGVLKNRRADGSSYIKSATIVPLKDLSGQITEYLSSGQDITELVENRRVLANAFSTDALTGLGSRMRLLNDIAQAERPVLTLIDIEGFSHINQAFGTLLGDQVLRELGSSILTEAQKQHGSAYRVSGDTFGILCDSPEVTATITQALALPEKLHSLDLAVGEEPLSLILRVGISADGKDSFMCADMALGQARQTHKRAVLFDASNAGVHDPLNNVATLQKIYWALDHDLVYPVFQPILDLATGAVCKYECLMRAQDEDGNTLMPGQFIEISKKTGLYQLLTFRIIEKSIAAFRHNGHDFSINLTIEDLANGETIAFLLNQSRRNGLAKRLIVEIVETEELEDFESANQALDELRAAGIRIAIDDFGSGYASFEYLLKLSPAFIKIDRAIVSQLESDPRAVQLIRSIVHFAKTTSIATVAEFIDTQSVLDLVKELGVDFAQGWRVGKALPQLLATTSSE